MDSTCGLCSHSRGGRRNIASPRGCADRVAGTALEASAVFPKEAGGKVANPRGYADRVAGAAHEASAAIPEGQKEG